MKPQYVSGYYRNKIKEELPKFDDRIIGAVLLGIILITLALLFIKVTMAAGAVYGAGYLTKEGIHRQKQKQNQAKLIVNEGKKTKVIYI